jgi:hypothetical protein
VPSKFTLWPLTRLVTGGHEVEVEYCKSRATGAHPDKAGFGREESSLPTALRQLG